MLQVEIIIILSISKSPFLSEGLHSNVARRGVCNGKKAIRYDMLMPFIWE
jgi:repressor of nif and glnA expression